MGKRGERWAIRDGVAKEARVAKGARVGKRGGEWAMGEGGREGGVVEFAIRAGGRVTKVARVVKGARVVGFTEEEGSLVNGR